MTTGTNSNRRLSQRCFALIALMGIITLASTRLQAETGTCGGASTTLPFTDVSAGNGFFCSIAEAFFSGLTNGTTATTYEDCLRGRPIYRQDHFRRCGPACASAATQLDPSP